MDYYCIHCKTHNFIHPIPSDGFLMEENLLGRRPKVPPSPGWCPAAVVAWLVGRVGPSHRSRATWAQQHESEGHAEPCAATAEGPRPRHCAVVARGRGMPGRGRGGSREAAALRAGHRNAAGRGRVESCRADGCMWETNAAAWPQPRTTVRTVRARSSTRAAGVVERSRIARPRVWRRKAALRQAVSRGGGAAVQTSLVAVIWPQRASSHRRRAQPP